MKCILSGEDSQIIMISKEQDPTLYFSMMPNYFNELKEKQKSIIFVGKNFIYGFSHEAKAFDKKTVEDYFGSKCVIKDKVGKKKKQIKGVTLLTLNSKTQLKEPLEFFKNFKNLKIWLVNNSPLSI